MDFLTDWLTNWLKELLIGGIMGNLEGLFDTVNTQVGEIAAQVGTTPAAWHAGVFSLIRQLSETVILPIAGMVLTFVATYELIQMLSENLPDVPHVFISSVTGTGIAELKDLLWKELNSESNKLQAITGQSKIVHKNKDLKFLQNELKAMGEDEDIQFVDEEEIEDLDDFEYEEDWDDEPQK